MARLTAQAVRRLRAAGWQAGVARPLEALPRPDSASLTVTQRRAAAESSLRIRSRRIGFSRQPAPIKGTLVVVDDIVTTGATLAAVKRRLEEADMQVRGAAVLAATQLRRAVSHDYRLGVPKRRKVNDQLSETRGDAGASAR